MQFDKRFNYMKVEIVQCNESVVVTTFYQWLLFVKTKLGTMKEAFMRTQKYTNVEEEFKLY